MPRKYIDLVGLKYAKLLVLEKAIIPSNPLKSAFLCKCDCGNEKVVKSYALRNLTIVSCGCDNKNKMKVRIRETTAERKIRENTHKKRIKETTAERKIKENTYIREKLELKPKPIYIQLKDYHTGEIYNIVSRSIMSMEERHIVEGKTLRHLYTSVYIYSSLPSEKYEYRVKQTMKQIYSMGFVFQKAA